VSGLAGGGAGSGGSALGTAAGLADGLGTAARLTAPQGVALNPVAGLLFIADTGNNGIRVFNTSSGVVSSLAGSATGAAGFADGTGAAERFSSPSAVGFDPAAAAALAAPGGSAILYVTVSARGVACARAAPRRTATRRFHHFLTPSPALPRTLATTCCVRST
jgi:DNA-binding beta-propeller fold protein YncE